MKLVSILIALNVVTHVWFLVFEMFLWQSKFAQKAFRMSEQVARDSAVLAANQGLYNGFLAAGLTWGLCTADPVLGHALQVFFLSCMLVAGLFGGLSANKRILFLQALPALIPLAMILFSTY